MSHAGDEMDDGAAALPDADQIGEGLTQPAARQELDGIMSDPALSMEDRLARIEELRRQVSTGEAVDQSADYAPMQVQLANAFAMLAEGGHDYSANADNKSGEDPSEIIE